MKILADASLPQVAKLFGAQFAITYYASQEELCQQLAFHDILLCRSTLKVDANLLANTPIRCIGTASSGTDHLDEAYLQQAGIQLFDAKGCNARAVADYVIAVLAYLAITVGFVGKKAGIIGLGAVGSQVANRLKYLGYEIKGYDPYQAATVFLDDLSACDLICVHPKLHDNLPFPSRNLLSTSFLKQLQPNTVLINASRGGIVNESALLQLEKPLLYCTDVFQNEPHINPDIVNYATLCTPHIAGHSIEAKQKAVQYLSAKIHDYYHLPAPQHLPAAKKQQVLSKSASWEEVVLALYNPAYESEALKKAFDKPSAFLKNRQAHHFRHDFNHYQFQQLSALQTEILGLTE